MQSKGCDLVLTLLKMLLEYQTTIFHSKKLGFTKFNFYLFFWARDFLNYLPSVQLCYLYPISEALWDSKMSAYSSDSHVGFYEQNLADLQQELKRLKVIADKGRPSEPENIVDWEKSYNHFEQLQKRIQSLLAEQEAVSDLL